MVEDVGRNESLFINAELEVKGQHHCANIKALNMANVEMRRTVRATDSTYSLTHRSPDLKFLKLLLFFWELISFKTTFI